MRKHALAGSLTIHATALLLLLLLGTIARNSVPPPPAVILFGPPLLAPRQPEVPVDSGGHAPQPVKRRLFLPPMLALNDHPELERLPWSRSGFICCELQWE